jgi:hypothetical protein
MTDSTSLESLAGARLLRVESHGARAWSLRFDRAELSLLLEDGALELEVGVSAELAPGAESLDETDPWWTVLGTELRSASAERDAQGRAVRLVLLFRADSNPKRIAVFARGDRLRAEAASQGEGA